MGCHEIVVALLVHYMILEKVKAQWITSSPQQHHFILIKLKKTSSSFNIIKI